MATVVHPFWRQSEPRLGAIRRAWRQNPPLAVTGIIMVGVLLATLVGLAADPRQLLNEPVWLKPAKFAVSIAIYSFTLLWLITFIERRRLAAAASWVIAATLVFEELMISYQAMRGVRSHFNEATAFDIMLFRWMTAAIVLLWLATLLVAILLLRQRFQNPVMAWALRFGIVLGLIGMLVAVLMPQATPSQRESLRTTDQSEYIGAHSVGVEDGGPGLPIVGWSTVGGDLRVPHFVGLHSLQVLPIIGWLLLLIPAGWLTLRDRARLMVIAGFGGLGLVALLTWQALRGQPLIAPDGQTVLALVSGVFVMGVAAAAVMLTARRRLTDTRR